MDSSESLPKLRMASRSAEDLAARAQREQLAANQQREVLLGQSLHPFRVGSVKYLNAVPLTRGLEDEVTFATPSQLAGMLDRDELDAAMVSVTEVLLRDRYDVVDGIAIASLGEVKSVLLAHRGPLENAREIYCDPASLTSVNLLRVLLAERGIKAELKPLVSYEQLPDYALLIGDRALDLVYTPGDHSIFDLGAAFNELTGLPFVYAVWAVKRGLQNAGRLAQLLREARKFGLDTLDSIVRERTEYDYDFRKDYLGWHIHYHLGADEKRGIAKFMELLSKHEIGQVYAPKFVL
jgi:chorismate dehydratase